MGEHKRPDAVYRDKWPKPMFFCTACDEQTDSDPCDRCYDPDADSCPQVLHLKVVPLSALHEAEARLEAIREVLIAERERAEADYEPSGYLAQLDEWIALAADREEER